MFKILKSRVDFAAVLLALACGCAPNLSTQPLRLDYLRALMRSNAEQAFGCAEIDFQFARSEQRSGAWFDYYVAKGCGGTSDYVTQLKMNAEKTSVSWAFAAVPQPSAFFEAAKQQLLKPIRFELACESDIEFVALSETIETMQTSYRVTLGVKGCGKQATYEVGCAHSGFVQLKHEIVCQKTLKGN
jgi:hypothetical protein